MKILTIFLLVIVLIAGGFIFLTKGAKEDVVKSNYSPTTTQQVEETKLNASFAIFTNSTFRIFTDAKYLNQSDEVYMEEANIVTVRREGITWADFFKTLPMELTKDCLITGTGQKFCSENDQKLRFFINSVEDSEVLSKEIKNGDKLLISFGDKTQEQIAEENNRIPPVQ